MVDPKEKHVFISVGSRYNSEQQAFLDALIKLLENCGVTPRVMNLTRRDYPTGSPLLGVSAVLRECHGAIIVAFERKYVKSGVENRGSDRELELHDKRFTTPWNQIEAAIAFTRGIPIIVLAETGLHEEGLLEQKYDWYIQRLPINSVSLENNEVRQRIQVWCEKLMAERVPDKAVDPITADWTIVDFVKRLTFKTAVQIVLLLSLIFGSGVTVGKWFQGSPVTVSTPRS